MALLSNTTFYIVPSWKCNLHCPHCFVNNVPENINLPKIIDTLVESKKQFPDAGFVLHGGEPTYNKDIFKSLLQTNIINSITSNLITTDPEIIQLINDYKLSVATSWNPSRFQNQELFNIWQKNIFSLNQQPLLLITLDQDLIKIKPSEVIQIFKTFQGIDKILFEPLLDNSLTDEFQDKADEFLCEIYQLWDLPNIRNLICDQILHWDFACNSYTILPNGDIHKKCSLADNNHKPTFLKKCLHCKYNKVCTPCNLHTRCSFYPKFYEMVKANA